MDAREIAMYLDEYGEYLRDRNFDGEDAVLAALFLEEVFELTLSDDEITEENLGSIDRIRTFVTQKLRSDGLCAVSAE